MENEIKERLEKTLKEMEPMMERLRKQHAEMMEKDIMKMTRKELQELENFKPEGAFNGVVIVPMQENHDSDYSCMKFILLDHLDIVGVVGGNSDVVHLNGIGGYGKDLKEMDKPKRHAWSIDCLPVSKCVRLFCMEPLEIDEWFGSDFSVYVRGINDGE